MDLKKAFLLRKAKYLKRTGAPGHYKYVYYQKRGRKQTGRLTDTHRKSSARKAYDNIQGGSRKHDITKLSKEDKQWLEDNKIAQTPVVNKYKVMWLSGASKGITTIIESGDEKLRIGSVRTGNWGAKYKVVGKVNSVKANPEKVKQPNSSPDGTQADWTPEGGGILFHGTSASNETEYLKGDKDGVVYLTDDYKEAVGYAKGIHLGGSSGGDARVLYLSVASGKTVDVDSETQEEVVEGTGDFGPIFKKARKAGADFATYTHPSNVYEDKEQKVIVALNPGDQLGPNRNGWDIGKGKSWRKEFKR